MDILIIIFKVYLAVGIVTYIMYVLAAKEYAKSIVGEFYAMKTFNPFSFSSLKLLFVSFVPILNIILLYLIIFETKAVFSKADKKYIKD